MSEEQVNKTIDDELHSEQQLEKFLRTATPASIRYRLTKIPTGINEQIDYLNRLLKVISELDVEPVHVFSMLESVRPVVYEKFTAMTSRFLGKQTAFPPRVQALLGQAAALQGHLASCYDNVVEEAQFHGDSQAFIIGSAVQRAMADKANLLLCYLQLYLPVPQQLWRQFNKLYVTAHKYKLLGQVTPDPILFSTKPLNLKHTYLYAMMLGCADASHFNVTEITALSNALKEWVSQITIVEKPDAANPTQLGINLDTSAPPVFKPDIRNPTTSNVIYLQLDKLIKFLQNPAVSRLNQATPPPPQELVDKVIDAWTVHRPKSTDRVARTDDIICTLGFNNVHYYLMGGKDLAELSAKLPLPEIEPIGKLVYGDIPREFNFHTLKPGEPGILAPRYTCHEIRVIDESPTGYCLEWPAEALSLLTIGEVIGLKERTSPYWKVGEINWMKKTEAGLTRTGILLQSTEAIPLLARTPKGLPNKGNYFSALLLPAESTLNRTKVEALVPDISLQMGEKLWVTQENSKHALQLMTPLKQKNTVCHFECAYIVGTS